MSLFKKKPETLAKTTLERIKICKNKKSTLARQSRNDAAQLLHKAQYEKALARVELVCKEENMVITYELLADYCQLFLKRVGKLRSGKECPEDLKGAIATMLYVAPRCGDLPELQEIRTYLRSIYGDEFCTTVANIESESNLVDRKIIGGLSTQPPNQETKISVLKAVATEHQIPWNPAIENLGVKSMTVSKSRSSDSNLLPKDTPAPASEHRGHELAREGLKDNHGNARGQVKPIASDKAKDVEEHSTVREFEASERKPSVKPPTSAESSIPAKGGIMEHKKPIGVKKDDRYHESVQVGSNGAANKYPQRDDCNNDKSSIRYSKLSTEHHDGDKEMLNRRGSGQLAGKGASNSPKRQDHHNNISSTRYNQLSGDHQDGDKGMLNRRGSDQLPINVATNSRQRDDLHDNIPSARSDKLSTDHHIDGEKEMLSRRASGQSSDKVNSDLHIYGEKEMLSRRVSGQSRQRSLRLKQEKELMDQLKAAAEEAFRSAAEAEEAAGVAEAAVVRASPRTRASVKGRSHEPNSIAVPRLDTENVDHRKSEGRSSQAEAHAPLVDHAAPPRHEYYPQLVPKAVESSQLPIQIDEEREKTRFYRNSRVNPSGNSASGHQDREEVKHVVYPDESRWNLPKFDEAKEEETILLSKPKPRSFDNDPHTKNKVDKYGEPPAQNNVAPRFDDSDGDKDYTDEEEWHDNGSGKGANFEKHVGHDLRTYGKQHISSDKPLRPHWVPEPHTSYDDLNEFEPAEHHMSTQYGITGRSRGMPLINEAYNRQPGMIKGGGQIKTSPDSGTMEDRARGRYVQPIRKPGDSKHDLDFDDDDDDEHTSKSGSNDSNIRKPGKYSSSKLPSNSKYGQFVDVKAPMYRQKDASQPWEIEHDKPPYGRGHPPTHTANEIGQYVEIGKNNGEEEEEEDDFYKSRRRGSAGYAKKVTRASIDRDDDDEDDGYYRSRHQHREGYQSTHLAEKWPHPEHVPSKPQRSFAHGSAEEGRSKQNAEWDTRNATRISSVKPKQLGTIGMRQLRWNSTRNNIPSDDDDDDDDE